MWKFIRPKSDINPEKDVVAPILHDLISRVTSMSLETSRPAKIVRQNYSSTVVLQFFLNWEKKYPWLLC